MHASMLSLLSLPLLAAAAPAPPHPTQPAVGTTGITPDPTYCTPGTGPDRTPGSAFFAGVVNVLSQVKPAWDTPLNSTFSLTPAGEHSHAWIIQPVFTFSNQNESNPDLCYNTVRGQMSQDITGGATGGVWTVAQGQNRCQATMVINLFDVIYPGSSAGKGRSSGPVDACNFK